MVIVNQDINTLKNEGMYPFKEGVYAGAEMIMPTHAVFPALDDSKITVTDDDGNTKEVPTQATFSKKILTDILRNEIGFDGVVITDAVDMGAVTIDFSEAERTKMALNAGCDIVLMPYVVYSSDDIKGFDIYFKELVEMVESGEIKEERLDEVVRRILTLKVKNKLHEDNKISLNEKLINVEKVVGCKEHKDIEKLSVDKAVTLVKNEDGILTLKLEENKTITFITGEYTVGYKDNIESLCKKMDSSDYVVVAPYLQLNPGYGFLPWYYEDKIDSNMNKIPGKLIDYANKNNKKCVALAVREPYGISYMNNVKAIVATYAGF